MIRFASALLQGITAAARGRFPVLQISKQAFVSALLLLCFIAARGLFWFSLALPAPQASVTPIGSAAAPLTEAKPQPKPCACTGAPVCPCGPGGCCAADEAPSVGGERVALVAKPELCGKLGQGLGSVGDGVLTLIEPAWQLIYFVECQWLTFASHHPFDSIATPPDSPPPKA